MATELESVNKTFFFREIARYLVYAVLVYLVAEFLRWTAASDDSEAKFPEQSLVEYVQSFLLVVSGLLCLWFFLSKNRYPHRHIFMLIAALSGMALIREQDMHFETFVGDKTWPIPVFAILLLVLWKVFQIRKELLPEIVSYMKTKSYAFFTFATITLFIFARLFGRTVFWETVMEDQYFRSVKNVAEESLELYGYLFFLFAVIELIMSTLQVPAIGADSQKEALSTKAKIE